MYVGIHLDDLVVYVFLFVDKLLERKIKLSWISKMHI